MEPTDVNAAIGRALKHLRAPTGVGQVELADRLGIDQTTVSRWERGLDAFPAYRVVQIEDALGLARGALWSAAGLMGLTSVETAIYADPGLGAMEQRTLVATYQALRNVPKRGGGAKSR